MSQYVQMDMFAGHDNHKDWGKPKPRRVYKRFYVVARWSRSAEVWMHVVDFGENGARWAICGKHGSYAFHHRKQAELIAKQEGGVVQYYDLCVGERSVRYE